MPKTPSLVRAVNTPPVVIAVAMEKGGTCKTTTAVNLSYELSRLELYDEAEEAARPIRVLLVDIDPQGNATTGLGADTPRDGDLAPSLYNALHPEKSRRVPLNDVIIGTDFGVDVACGPKRGLGELDKNLGPGGQMRLRREIESIPAYDFVIIDCPPALNELTSAALSAATWVLAPIAVGPDEMDGLASLEGAVENCGLNNPGVKINYVLLTRYLGNSRARKAIRRQVETDWPKEYLGEISDTVRVVEAKAHRKPISVHAPSCTAAEDYARVARILAQEGLISYG